MNEKAIHDPLVAIVDDQRDVRTTLGRGLASFGFRCHPFASGPDLLEALEYLYPDCILLDLRMPEMDGVQTLKAIPASRRHIPVIFFTSHGDIPRAVEAIKLGAADFIEKPCSIKNIAEKIRGVVEEGSGIGKATISTPRARQMIDQLTDREREIMRLACTGLSNKEIATLLGLSVRTVETHRLNAMKSLGEKKLVQIVRIYQSAEGG